MMETRTAACHCGDLTVTCEGVPAKISMCHCRDCQRRSGSTFSIAAFYPRECVKVQGPAPAQWQRPSASGYPVTFHFCRRCGSNVFWEPARMPDSIGVAAGAFADPDFPPPQQSVRMKEKHAWVAVPGDAICFDDLPPSAASAG